MDINSYLDSRLNHWVSYIIKLNCGGIGYPTQSMMYEIYRMGGFISNTEKKSSCLINMSEWADEINGLINRMKEHHPSWSEAIYLYYTRRENKKKLAKEAGVSTRTLRERVRLGRQWLIREIDKKN